MNVLLRKILINLSMLVFAAAFAISYFSGVPVLDCFMRASISLLVVGVLGRFVLTNFLKDIALALNEYETKRREEIKRQKMAEDDEEYLTDNEESEFDDIYSGNNNERNNNSK